MQLTITIWLCTLINSIADIIVLICIILVFMLIFVKKAKDQGIIRLL